MLERGVRRVSEFVVEAEILVGILFPALGELAGDLHALQAQFLYLPHLFLHALATIPLDLLLREPILAGRTTGTVHRHIQHEVASLIDLVVHDRVHLVSLSVVEHGQLVRELLLRLHGGGRR